MCAQAAVINDQYEQELDQLHGKVLQTLGQVLELSSSDFAPAFTQVVKVIELEFRREEQMMDTFQCPDAHQHREQHARMQAGLHHAAAAMEQGDPQVARRALSDLKEWLPYHEAAKCVRALHWLREHSQH